MIGELLLGTPQDNQQGLQRAKAKQNRGVESYCHNKEARSNEKDSVAVVNNQLMVCVLIYGNT